MKDSSCVFPTMALTEHMHRHLRNLHCALPICAAAMAVEVILSIAVKVLNVICILIPSLFFNYTSKRNFPF